jgi:hypothetical protein
MASGGIGSMVNQVEQRNAPPPLVSQNNTQTSGQGQMQPPQGGNLQGGGSPFGYGGMGGYGQQSMGFGGMNGFGGQGGMGGYGQQMGYGGMGGYGQQMGYGGGTNPYQQLQSMGSMLQQQPPQQPAAPDWLQSDEWKGYQTQRSDLQKQLEASDAWKGMQNLQTQMETYQQAHVPQQQPRYGGGYGGNYGGGFGGYGGGIGYPGTAMYKNGGKV